MKKVKPITSWDQINLKQLQAVYKLGVSEDKNIDVLAPKILNVLYGFTEEECQQLDDDTYKELLTPLTLLEITPFAFHLTRFLKANGNLYYIELDPDKLPESSRLSVLKYFPKKHMDFASTMHYIVARVVVPMKKDSLGLWQKQKHKLSEMDLYMEDMLHARVSDVKSIVDYYQFLSWGVTPKKSIEQNEDLIANKCYSMGMTTDQMLATIGNFHKIVHVWQK